MNSEMRDGLLSPPQRLLPDLGGKGEAGERVKRKGRGWGRPPRAPSHSLFRFSPRFRFFSPFSDGASAEERGWSLSASDTCFKYVVRVFVENSRYYSLCISQFQQCPSPPPPPSPGQPLGILRKRVNSPPRGRQKRANAPGWGYK